MANSWNDYINSLEVKSVTEDGEKHIDHACIIGISSQAPWTSDEHTDHLRLCEGECPQLVWLMTSKNESLFYESGVTLSGTKYNCVKVDKADTGDIESVFGKKLGNGSIYIEKTGQAIIIVHVKEGGQIGAACKSVGDIKAHLKEQNM